MGTLPGIRSERRFCASFRSLFNFLTPLWETALGPNERLCHKLAYLGKFITWPFAAAGANGTQIA